MLELDPSQATARSLAHFTSTRLIIPALRRRDCAGVIQELGQLLVREACVTDFLPFYHAAINREFLHTTALAYGIAAPHARVPGLERLWFAFGRLAEPMGWGGKGAVPVNLVFLSAAPVQDTTPYLTYLSGLGRLIQDGGLLQRLSQSTSALTLWRLLEQVSLRQVQVPPSRLGVAASPAAEPN
jgi:mannitol/fructose-specific phosphotransferase system IIA component (Ntr-type)